jgi:hypothetical protein
MTPKSPHRELDEAERRWCAKAAQFETDFCDLGWLGGGLIWAELIRHAGPELCEGDKVALHDFEHPGPYCEATYVMPVRSAYADRQMHLLRIGEIAPTAGEVVWGHDPPLGDPESAA